MRLLASDQPGEILAAAAALSRTLRGAGLDIHSLADAIEQGATPSPQPARATPRQSRHPQPGDVELDALQRRTVEAALRRGLAGDRLSAWETTFVSSILSRLQDGRGRLTGRQAETIAHLLEKIEGRH